jgi:hypothetical protein
MKKSLKTHLGNSQEIRNVLREVDIAYKFGGQCVETLLVYLPCKDGVCDHSDFFLLIKQIIMTNFVFSFTEIEKKLSIKSDKSAEELFKKAVRKISTHTAKGELGELILFTLLEVYFNAPKLLSKISLKTSRQVAAFGADAVHAQYVDGTLRLYLGESKLRKSFTEAASSAAKSISNFMGKYHAEFDLIDSYIDFPEMDTEMRAELIDLLDPFSENNKNIPEILHAPCFIGFVDPSVFSDDEENYIKQYKKVAKEHIGDFYTKLQNKDININKTALFLLPFSSLDDLVKEFISYMGIEK